MKNQQHPKGGIVDLSFQFSLQIIKYCSLLEERMLRNIAYQLFKSGTSIGANVAEAQHAESKSDFIHKMKIAAKEAEETIYWLSLCQASSGYPNCDDLLRDIEPIIKIISRIIITAKKSLTYINPNHTSTFPHLHTRTNENI